LDSLFEAARWAPSCFNEQPWFFLYASSEEDLIIYHSLLVEANQVWANKAPVLAFALARTKFTRNQTLNAWAEFDTGAAWMSLALEAYKLGLITHGMGGFLEDKAYEVLNIPREDFKVICAIAIGYQGDPNTLPAKYAESEHPNDRKPHSEVVKQGKF
jgi:nitroreductase